MLIIIRITIIWHIALDPFKFTTNFRRENFVSLGIELMENISIVFGTRSRMDRIHPTQRAKRYGSDGGSGSDSGVLEM